MHSTKQIHPYLLLYLPSLFLHYCSRSSHGTLRSAAPCLLIHQVLPVNQQGKGFFFSTTLF